MWTPSAIEVPAARAAEAGDGSGGGECGGADYGFGYGRGDSFCSGAGDGFGLGRGDGLGDGSWRGDGGWGWGEPATLDDPLQT